jgi:hypothetical protein
MGQPSRGSIAIAQSLPLPYISTSGWNVEKNARIMERNLVENLV